MTERSVLSFRSGQSRREFLGTLGAGAAVMSAAACASGGGGSGHTPRAASSDDASLIETDGESGPLIVSTWNFGVAANGAALEQFSKGQGDPLDACEAGVRLVEGDPKVTSVGYGGLPNAEGKVQLDAAVMRGDNLACGGVGGLEGIRHPVSVARRVMESTPHVLLVGQGAHDFAVKEGFPVEDLLTDEIAERWKLWKAEQTRSDGAVEPWEQSRNSPDPAPGEDHDTIGMMVRHEGRLAMAVTTSGLAWKLPGRVGDSPLIGAGGYCDDRAGAAVSTGVGEEVIRSCGSFAVVELMRQGENPAAAIVEVLSRIRETLGRRPSTETKKDVQVAFLAVDVHGRVGAMALQPGFQFALTTGGQTKLHEGAVLLA